MMDFKSFMSFVEKTKKEFDDFVEGDEIHVWLVYRDPSTRLWNAESVHLSGITVKIDGAPEVIASAHSYSIDRVYATKDEAYAEAKRRNTEELREKRAGHRRALVKNIQYYEDMAAYNLKQAASLRDTLAAVDEEKER